MLKVAILFALHLIDTKAQSYETGDNSSVIGCSSHCSAYDGDLSCLNRSLQFYEHVLLAQMKHLIAVQIHIDQWYKWHGQHRNYTQVREEIITKLSAKLDPEEDVIDTNTIATVIDVLIEKVENESETIEAEIPHFSCPLPCEYRYDIWRNVFIASMFLNLLLVLAVIPFIISLIRSDVPEPLMDEYNKTCKELLSDELDLLKAMYKDDELVIDEPQDSTENGQVTQLILRQQIDRINYEVVIHLDSKYPIVVKPSVFVRCSMINCNLLNQELRYFIDQESLGVPLILNIIQWIIDNINRFENRAIFYRLDGFFCSGKPGIIIVEGLRTDCYKFWEQIRKLNWQHIVLRYCEEQTTDQKSFLRLGKFREIYFPSVEYLTELKKLLTEVGLEYGFPLLLNL
ncbi:Zinc finger protein GLIS2-like protein [Dirofilaria immitis]|nr:Zinc finger protein GLIS2-like protein [Dirofilaria immitis]